MADRLKGKAAVVTGSGDGIGRAVALALAEEGARVVVNDIGRDADGAYADKVVAEIKKSKGTAVANYDSVATMAGGANIIKTAISNFGRVDILVNCAGNFSGIRPSVDVKESEWDSIMAVHLKGHFSCCQAAVKEMVKQKTGRIINVSSRAAFFTPFCVDYSVAKAGILGLTASMAAEFKDSGITVNCIWPSAKTKLFPNAPKVRAPGVGPDGRLTPDYVAPLIAFLSTDEAKDITGRIFFAGGGDVCLYAQPMKFPAGAPTWFRKNGKWTIDELSQVIPPTL